MHPPNSGDSIGDLIDTGTVVRSFPDMEAYDVALDKSGVTELNCISVVGGIFLPFFGFKLHTRLAVGAKVIVLRSTPCYILATVPVEPPDTKVRGIGSATTGEADVRDMGDDAASGHNMSHYVPKDILEGEFNIANALKVGITFLTSMIKLQAGDRAKVECFVMDDLVRVVSGAFHHMSDFGDFKIYNDNGQVTCRWQGTSYDHEAWGVKQARDPRVQSNTGGKLPTDPVAEEGRWRFQQFLGYMGDFMHFFLSDPTTALGTLAQDSAGKLHIHCSNDGSFLMQSLADICFEQVTRITVPQEQKRYDDPNGDTPDAAPSPEFLDTWRIDPDRPWTLAYHIRDYARWMNSYHAYARFLQKPLDWKIPSEAESPAPSYASGEKDREAAIPGAQRTPRVIYSCSRQLRDGSIMWMCGYGGSWTLSGGSAVLSVPKDIRLEAGRDIILLAGRSLFAKAFRNVEMVAVTGALIAKARTRLALWCESGTLLLRTLMKRGAAGAGDPKAHRFQRDNVGIVIDAPNADTVISSGGQTTVEGFGKDVPDKAPGVLVQSGAGDVHIRTSAAKSLLINAGAMATRVKNYVTSATEGWQVTSQNLNFGNALFVAKGRLQAVALYITNLMAKSITHGTQLKRSKDQHINHVHFGDVSDVKPPPTPEGVSTALDEIPQPANASRSDAELLRPVCDYLSRGEYGAEVLPQAPAQQIANNPGAQHPAGVSFADWSYAEDDTEGDPDAACRKPWPGENAQMLTSPSKAVLHEPSTDTADTFKPNPEGLKPEPAAFKRWTA